MCHCQQSEVRVAEDFRLKAVLPTLRLCLGSASQVIIMGHLGRPEGVETPDLSVEPIYYWLEDHNFGPQLESGHLKLLENLRFEVGEDDASIDYAHELVNLVDPPPSKGTGFFVNEAFAAYHKAASTTVLPTILPHGAGFRFDYSLLSFTAFLNLAFVVICIRKLLP